MDERSFISKRFHLLQVSYLLLQPQASLEIHGCAFSLFPHSYLMSTWEENSAWQMHWKASEKVRYRI